MLGADLYPTDKTKIMALLERNPFGRFDKASKRMETQAAQTEVSNAWRDRIQKITENLELLKNRAPEAKISAWEDLLVENREQTKESEKIIKALEEEINEALESTSDLIQDELEELKDRNLAEAAVKDQQDRASVELLKGVSERDLEDINSGK